MSSSVAPARQAKRCQLKSSSSFVHCGSGCRCSVVWAPKGKVASKCLQRPCPHPVTSMQVSVVRERNVAIRFLFRTATQTFGDGEQRLKPNASKHHSGRIRGRTRVEGLTKGVVGAGERPEGENWEGPPSFLGLNLYLNTFRLGRERVSSLVPSSPRLHSHASCHTRVEGQEGGCSSVCGHPRSPQVHRWFPRHWLPQVGILPSDDRDSALTDAGSLQREERRSQLRQAGRAELVEQEVERGAVGGGARGEATQDDGARGGRRGREGGAGCQGTGSGQAIDQRPDGSSSGECQAGTATQASRCTSSPSRLPRTLLILDCSLRKPTHRSTR